MKIVFNPLFSIDKFDDGDSVIYDPETKDTHILNKMASLIIDLCSDNSVDSDKLAEHYCDAVLKQFETVDKETALRDFKLVFEEMLSKKILLFENA